MEIDKDILVIVYCGYFFFVFERLKDRRFWKRVGRGLG